MKRIFISVSTAILAFLMACPYSAEGKRRWDWSGFDEVKIGVGIPSLAVISSYGMDNGFSPDTYCGNGYMLPTFSLGYEYNIKSWFSIEAGVSFAMAYRNHYDILSDRIAGRDRNIAFGLHADAKFYWLNRKYVRMYSSAGLSTLFAIDKSFDPYYKRDSWYADVAYVIPSVKFIGITAGYRIYGFAELGFGHDGIVRAGIGYRF